MQEDEDDRMKELFSIETAMKSGRAITFADPSNLVFKGPNGEYYDAAGQRIEYVPPVSPEEQKRREEEQETAEHAEHIRNVCSGLESFTDAEIEWEIGDGFGHFGFKDLDGNVVIEPQYAWAGEFSHGLCPVNLNRTWYRSGSGSRYYENHFGYIDTNGKTVIPFRYDEATSLTSTVWQLLEMIRGHI